MHHCSWNPLLSHCTAARPCIAMLEVATFSIVFAVLLTLRRSLPAHRLLLANGTTLYSSAGRTTAKYAKESLGNPSKPPEFDCARRVQRCLASWQEGARRGCGAPPWYLATPGRAQRDPLACSRAQGSSVVLGGRAGRQSRSLSTLHIGSNFLYVLVMMCYV